MHLTDLLSDLNSLRACDPIAALNLVSLRSTPVPSNTQSHAAVSNKNATSPNENSDPDLTRPGALLNLHRTVKTAYTSTAPSGNGSALSDLRKAREDVRRVSAGLYQAMNVRRETQSTLDAANPAEFSGNTSDEEVAAWS